MNPVSLKALASTEAAVASLCVCKRVCGAYITTYPVFPCPSCTGFVQPMPRVVPLIFPASPFFLGPIPRVFFISPLAVL